MPKMAEDSLRTAIDSISRRLHDELDAQLAQLSSRHQDELDAVRRAAEAEAEGRWSARVDDVRTEWTARLESEISAARAEAERRMVAESMRLRVEAEQSAAEANARLKQELEAALQAEREQAAARLATEQQQSAGERERLERELDDARQQLEALRVEAAGFAAARSQLEAALEDEQRAREEDHRQQEQRAAAAAEARVAERQSQLAIVERMLTGIRALDSARSLSQVMSTLLTAAAAEAPRVALFVVNGTALQGWKAEGFGVEAASLQAGAEEDGLMHAVLNRAEPVAVSDGEGPRPPAFAQLPHGRAAIAIPLLVGGQPVAVLYADDVGERQPDSPAPWPEAVQILSRHASVNLAHLTAARAADAMRRSLAPPPVQAPRPSAPAPAEDNNSARRYARLLVSEIKLYNEAAVRAGREKRDLLARLKPEIERARHLYEQRISPAVDSRGALFQQELVQTLADGDPALLGGPA